MIVTRTPFRVTLGGGGTDLPSYYEKHGGFIFAMGIDKYMYVMTNPPVTDRKIRVHYSIGLESAEHYRDLKHELAREALRLHKIESQMEIASMADISAGTGVGSSSCYLVGLLTALHHYRREYVTLHALAEEACHIELDVLKKGIGKQDQYMATFGGLTVLEITMNGKVNVRPVELDASSVAAFVANTHIYFTGSRRDAVEMLSEQNAAMQSRTNPGHQQVADSLHRIKDLGYRILEAIEHENFDTWGELLHEHWQQKKRLSGKISLPHVDEIYGEVCAHYGVLGGKLIGAGGGGFLMLYCPGNHKKLERFMQTQGMPRLRYTVEPEGSKVVANMTSTRVNELHALASVSDEV
ncbi:MAG: galactokinase [Nitrospira sp.]|nr:MAG: galactokinase [Nitrospira sp.]